MQYADFNEEMKFWKKGYKYIVGLDESGRGPLAGPVVASAVTFVTAKFKNLNSKIKIINQRSKLLDIEKIRDSKKLTKIQKEKWYEFLTNHSDIKWGTGIVSEKIIDKINILEATKLAMVLALNNLGVKPEYLLIDGNFLLEDLSYNPDVFGSLNGQKCIPRADENVISCAAASIIAKVTRDRLMLRYHRKYPQYGFDRHKGYGTKLHLECLNKFGPCRIHRKSFKPVKFL